MRTKFIQLVLAAAAGLSMIADLSAADVVCLKTANESVAVDLTGARVLSYVSHGQELLADPRSPEMARWPGQGGIPLCWPWFGSGGPDPKVKHGFISQLPFRVLRKNETQGRAELVLAASSSGARDGYPDHLADVELAAVLENGLSLKLTTVNRGADDFRFTAGFHPYFAVSDPAKTVVEDLAGLSFCDARRNHDFTTTWQGPLRFDTDYDHVFDEVQSSVRHVLVDQAGGRSVLVEATGARRTVVWNETDGRRFVCVEPVICWKDREVVLCPGESHSLTMRVSLAGETGAMCGKRSVANVAVAPIELKDVKRLPLAASVATGVPETLDFTTPQNAVKAVTLAVANRSAETATYRVALGSDEGTLGFRRGFPGFPVKNVSCFKVLTTAGAEADVGAAPLVGTDEPCTVAIPAGQAAIVRLEFDAADILPRMYRSCLSVTRIDAEEVPVRVPVSLEILPRRLPELPPDALVLSAPAADERTFRLMNSLGFRTTCLDPKLFHFGRGKGSDFDMALFPPDLVRLETVLSQQRNWNERFGVTTRWQVAGDCRAAVRELYALTEGTEEEKRFWTAWTKAAEWRLECFGSPKGAYAFGSLDAAVVRKFVDPESLVNRTLGVALPNVRSALLRDEITALRETTVRPKASSNPETADVIVYGATSAGIAAAVQARRMGLSCTVIEPTQRIGGLTTGGLGQTDIGNKDAIGGLSRRFYRDVCSHYANPKSWTRQKPETYVSRGQSKTDAGEETMWTFEPSVALAILESWEKTEDLTIVRGERLDRRAGKVKVEEVEVEGRGRQRRIVSFVTESGRTFRGKVFIDATYEGDLLAAAGVSYTVGREANALYGETLSGIQRKRAVYHQFAAGVSAYVKDGDPSSGLLPGLERDVSDPDGTGDRRVQAYCFRMCLTDDPENRIPFSKPEGYCELDYELLFRNFAALERTGKHLRLPWINSSMPNRKTDTNNRAGFSTDFIGGNWRYPEASYAERAEIERAHLRYQQGLMWTLANHPRVPAAVRNEVARWGTCKDEFVGERGDGWQNQLYVREGRRMVGDYVMTEANCRGTRQARRSIALAAYQMDSHHVRRYVDDEGCVQNEGDLQIHKDENGERFPPYPIDYGAIVPKRSECANLVVPVCLSASHMAFGSIRMEPVFFALGQAAGTVAVMAAEKGCAVQDLKYADLRRRLVADGQRL